MVEKEFVAKNHGFEYEKHFRGMMIKLIGLIEFERLERRMDPGKLAKFKSALRTLKAERDREAHTYVKGVTKIISAPSAIKGLFGDVEAGLLEFDRKLKKAFP